MSPQKPDFEATFERALISFKHYESFEKIPKLLFRRVREIANQERIGIEEVRDRIAQAIWEDRKERGILLMEETIGAVRSKVDERLQNCRPSNPGHGKVIRLVQPAE